MDVYQSESEQIEALKKWWDENGKSIIAGLVLGLGAIFGWRAWQDYTRQQAEAASGLYQQMLAAIENDTAIAEQNANRILRDYGSTTYAVLASMGLARLAAENSDYTSTAGHLRRALADNDIDNLEPLIRLRLAQALTAAGDYPTALDTLEKVPEPGAYAAAYDELRGDIHVYQEDLEAARSAYQLAIQKNREQQADTTVLEMKLENIGRPER